MKNIVEKISVFSRTDDNLRTTKVEDINYIINDSLLLLRKELELRNISLVLKLDGKLPKVIVNSIKMETALHNIIMNAKEELEEFPQKKDKKITISTEADKQNSFIVIKIADNGKGISGDNIMRVFDPFFTTKSFGTGATGLGLSIVHGIMNEVGGRVDIDTKEKSGTTLILRIPAVFEESE
jgi:signal transduction histidine kinase